MNDDETVILDPTSFCSLSKLYDMPEYGGNYRKTKLLQVIFSLVYSMTMNISMWYYLFPGNIADKATLKGALIVIFEPGSGARHAVMDHEFYGPDNLKFMLEDDIGFTIPDAVQSETAKTLVFKSNHPLDDPTCAQVVKDSVVWIWEVTTKPSTAVTSGQSHILMRAAGQNSRTRCSRVWYFKRRMPGTNWHTDIVKEATKSRNNLSLLKMVLLSKEPDGTVAVERGRNVMSFELNKCGKIIISTTSDYDALDALILYRLRNEADKIFETLKDELDGDVNGLSSYDSVSEMIFAKFVSVSLRYFLAERPRGAELPGKVWIPDALGLMRLFDTLGIKPNNFQSRNSAIAET